ncbi:thiosulfate oxidation carrier protein SoxY [Paramagnetospirillum kuznetsovii]|uniref:Thiosulfate oxidation carrier protein SoxY n=1 Tax=Paramagnetospirillum kuznetsovii TaxID=2053833 RepID=A0A364NU10_9PROT|nr:thiosulfate oxidation carrier protein SoxY [Paramagnetospirillum kuznetsovii]RAU20579.1 thiosulfate oxidation carrier protein SoxY [Paramagnetospirillum kuznetsovii]
MVKPESGLNRRQAMVAMGGAACVGVLPNLAWATPAEAEAAVKALIGSTATTEGRVQLKLPQIAENGATVQLRVLVDSPMTAADHVKAIHILAEGNPLPGVASFHFTARSGKADVSTRIRLGKTQNVHAVAVMSNGSVWRAKEEVKVTVGGC